MAAADIDDARVRQEVIGLRDRFVVTLAKSNHRTLKKLRLRRMVGKPVEPSLTKTSSKAGRPVATEWESFEKAIWAPVYHPDRVACTGGARRN